MGRWSSCCSEGFPQFDTTIWLVLGAFDGLADVCLRPLSVKNLFTQFTSWQEIMTTYLLSLVTPIWLHHSHSKKYTQTAITHKAYLIDLKYNWRTSPKQNSTSRLLLQQTCQHLLQTLTSLLKNKVNPLSTSNDIVACYVCPLVWIQTLSLVVIDRTGLLLQYGGCRRGVLWVANCRS